MAEPITFPEALNTLQPSGAKYSEKVGDVSPLPVWSNGEQCISCWRLSWRERFSALFFGRIWLSLLSGRTQVPACVVAKRSYFLKESE